jgi:hypothetical protein
MVLAPLLLIAGSGLLIGIYGPDSETLVSSGRSRHLQALFAHNLSVAGTILTALAVIGVSQRVIPSQPRLGRIGGVGAVAGLFGPAFFLGVYGTAFHADGSTAVARAVDAVQTVPHVINFTGPAILVGFVVLAIGAARSGLLPTWRCVALGLAAAAPVGLIAGIVPLFVATWVALAVAIVPLGLDILRGRTP